MQDLYETIKQSLLYNKFTLNDIVCVEYNCPLENERVGIYSQHDYILHVLSGKKTWKTIYGEWTVNAGETLFVKKGAAMIRQYFEDDFCMLGFFLPDDLIRESLADVVSQTVISPNDDTHRFTTVPLIHNAYLNSFFQSMLVYFRNKTQPHDSVLKIKLKELIANIIYSDENHALVSYLKWVTVNKELSLTHIMESNYCYNLSLEQYAKMCHRSLSTFKRDFLNHYNTTPGKWLYSKRLDHAAQLLRSTDMNITEITFECGFEDVSHFSRSFKEKFGVSPSRYNNILS